MLSLSLVAAPAVAAGVCWVYWASRKGYRIDDQGRYMVLDLERPRLPPQFALINVITSFLPPVKLDVETVIQSACKETGLSDFGDEEKFPFRDGLEKILSQARNSPVLTGLGRLGVQQQVVELLANRLQIEDLIKRHPEILDEVIAAPVFVTGLPRSGTTHVQRSLAQMEEFRALKLYEVMFPVVTEKVSEGIGRGTDPRMENCKAKIDVHNKIRPLHDAMHTTGADEFEEHIHLSMGVFRSMLFLVWLPCEEYLKWYGELDPTVELEYMRRSLQVIQWQDAQLGKPRKRFVLKNTYDLFRAAHLKKLFPDARMIHTHRAVEKSVLSGLYLSTYTRGVMCQEDIESSGNSYLQYLERGLRKVDWNGWGQHVFHVDFDDFVEDNVGTLKEGCKAVGLDICETSWDNVEKYINANRRHKHGKVHYDPKPFGSTEEEVKERVKFYGIGGCVKPN